MDILLLQIPILFIKNSLIALLNILNARKNKTRSSNNTYVIKIIYYGYFKLVFHKINYLGFP
jgi:hypothetical protein